MQKLSACCGLRSRSIRSSLAQIPPSIPRSSTTPPRTTRLHRSLPTSPPPLPPPPPLLLPAGAAPQPLVNSLISHSPAHQNHRSRLPTHKMPPTSLVTWSPGWTSTTSSRFAASSVGTPSSCTFPVFPSQPTPTRHPNNCGYALFITTTPQSPPSESPTNLVLMVLPRPTQFSFQIPTTPSKSTGLVLPSPRLLLERSPAPSTTPSSTAPSSATLPVMSQTSVFLAISLPASLPPFIHAVMQRPWLNRSVVTSKGYGFVWCVIPLLSSQAPFYCRSVAERARYGATTSDPPLSLICNRLMSEADQIRALTEMQDLYYKYVVFSVLHGIFPSGRLSHATAKNKAEAADEEAPDTVPVAVRKAGCHPPR
jgi:hypothetical protein